MKAHFSRRDSEQTSQLQISRNNKITGNSLYGAEEESGSSFLVLTNRPLILTCAPKLIWSLSLTCFC